MVSTESTIKTEEIAYGEGSTLKGFLAYDSSKKEKLPGILIVHDAFGNGEYTKRRAIQLAEMGYIGFALDMFGGGKVHCTLTDARATIEEQFKNIDKTLALFQSAYDTLKSHEKVDGERIAAVGYCYGGTIVLNAARSGMDLKGVACFHGRMNALVKTEKGKYKGKALVCNGEIDPSITPEDIEAFKKEFDELGIEYKFVNYPGAKHGFTVPEATQRGIDFKMTALLEYNEKADKESWAELDEFLKNIFAK